MIRAIAIALAKTTSIKVENYDPSMSILELLASWASANYSTWQIHRYYGKNHTQGYAPMYESYLSPNCQRVINSSECYITVEAERETTDPADQFDDPSEVKRIKQAIANDYLWDWCVVRVRLELAYSYISSVQYIGCCSYEHRQDFIHDSGYYSDMVNECLADINEQWQAQQTEEIAAA
jgi:hypothetical protein